MQNIQKAVLNKPNADKATAMGVVVEVVNNIGSVNPRHHSTLVWVGLDTLMPTHFGEDLQIQQVVARYINESEADFDSKNPHFFWRAIEKKTGTDGIDVYTLASEEEDDVERHYSEFAGFIYNNPSRSISADVNEDKKCLLKAFAKQVEEYNEWIKGPYLRVRSESGVYMVSCKLSTDIDKAAKQLLSNYSSFLGSHIDSLTMTVKLDSAPDCENMEDVSDLDEFSARVGAELIKSISSEISRNSVPLIYGEALYDRHKNEVCFDFLPNQMPSLAEIIKEKGNDFLKILKTNYRHVISLTGVREQNGWDLLEIVLTEVPFENMPRTLQITVYYALLEDAEGFEMLEVMFNEC